MAKTLKAEMLTQATEEVPVEDLQVHPRNPNEGDYGAIAESIKTTGFFGTLVANRRNNRILAGNHRYRVAKDMGFKTVPVSWVDVDEEVELRILVADNRTTRLGFDNLKSITEILAELSASQSGLIGVGYDGDDLDALLKRLSSTGFAPNTEPDIKEPFYDSGDIMKAEQKMDDKFDHRDDTREVMCIHCGGKFFV